MRRLIFGLSILLTGFIFGYQIGNRGNSKNQAAAAEKERTAVAQVNEISLECLTPEAISSIKNKASIDNDLPNCLTELKNAFGPDFEKVDDEGWRAIFATAIAANFAEYGDSSAITYEGISRSKYLNCGNTVLLTGYLFGDKNSNLRSIGFDGGAVGNHAQLYYAGKVNMLLDPTTGVIALTSFDELLRGTPVDENEIRVLSIKARQIDSFRKTVYAAVRNGAYQPSDFMYMHETIDEHRRKGSSDNYFTPGGIHVRHAVKQANNPTIVRTEK